MEPFIVSASTFYSTEGPHSTVVSFLLPFHDWCELQKLDCWEQVQHFLLQKENKDSQKFHRGNFEWARERRKPEVPPYPVDNWGIKIGE